jgi:hypothetical protein
MAQTKMPSFVGKLLHTAVEFGSRNLTYDSARMKLQASADGIVTQFAAAPDTPENRAQANHVIGMERWAQRRLRMALGDAPISDEYDGYRPGETLGMAELRESFTATRADSLKLVDALRQANVALTKKVPHNDMGQLSVHGWLMYLNMHSSGEAKKLKP